MKHCRYNVKLVTPMNVLQLQKHQLLPKKNKTICLLYIKFLEHDTHTMVDTYQPKKIINQSFDNILSDKLRLILLACDVSSIITNLAILYNLVFSYENKRQVFI